MNDSEHAAEAQTKCAASGARLAVGHFLNADFQSACAEFLPRLGEVFFAWPGVLSCRPAPEFTSELRSRMLDDLRWARSHGLLLDTLFNCNCYGEVAISHELADFVGRTLREMDSEGLFPDVVTTTSPFVAKVLRRDFPSVEIRWSVNIRVHGSVGFEYVLDDFDSFYVSREHHRDLGYLAELSAWAKAHGKRLGMQANSGCLRQCPYQTFHDNLHGHGEVRQNQLGMRDFDFTYFLCRRTFAKAEHREDFLRATWIRPEDLPEYEPFVDVVKLATRRHPDPVGVLRAYATRSYDGDLAALMDPVHPFAPRFDNRVLDAPLWREVRGCPHAGNCRHCGRCTELNSMFKEQ